MAGIKVSVFRWWHSRMFLTSVNYRTSISVIIQCWNIPKQSSVKWLTRSQNRVAAKNETSRLQILLLDFKGISEERIDLSKLREKEKDSQKVHIKLPICLNSCGQNKNIYKRICKQQTLFFILHFGQYQILPKGEKI